MPPRIDLTGQTFGRLTVVGPRGSNGRRALWECMCGCGAVCVANSDALRSRKKASCGCVKAAIFGPRDPRPTEDRLCDYVARAAADACWEFNGQRDRKGYGRLSRGRRGEGSTSAHRAAWIAANGAIPAGLCVLHRCDNPPCCNPAHLFLGTIADNNRDMAEKGRAAKTGKPLGEHNGNAKLSPDDVRAIRSLWTNPVRPKQRDIAARFGVDQQVVWSVIHRRTWAHVA